jgi:hypothetical protein
MEVILMVVIGCTLDELVDDIKLIELSGVVVNLEEELVDSIVLDGM